MGNTKQNIANLLSLCISEANGLATYARWDPTIRNGTAEPMQALEVYPPLVPGYVKPPSS